MTIRITNLGKYFKETDLRTLFSSFGTVQRAVIIRDRHSGLSKGAALVEMTGEVQARQAIKALHNSMYNGHKLSVSMEEVG